MEIINIKTIQNVYNIFSEIEQTSGKNDKVQIIKDNADNQDFRFFLNFLYNDMITTGLSVKKIDKEIKLNGVATVRGFDSPKSIMNHLDKFNTGTDKIILSVQTYLQGIDEPYQTFMKQVLTKSYKCGITASSVNKAIKGLIPEFKCQLAHSYEKYADKIKGEFTLTQKLDGHRTLAEVYEDGKVIFRTRKGHQILGMTELEDEFKNFFNISNKRALLIDGEITVSDKSIPIGDVFQATSKVIRKDGEKKGLTFHVFDILPLDEFTSVGESTAKYKERRSALNHLFKNSSLKPQRIELVEALYTGDNMDKIAEIMTEATNNGWEGIMLNLSSEPYRNKRTKGLLKVKQFFDADLECTGVFEGEGKYKGMLGGIYVEYRGNKVGVGSGFTDAEREYYWKHQDELVGSVIEITYFEETKNQKDDSLSLRFPIFKMLRDDKTLQDINY